LFTTERAIRFQTNPEVLPPPRLDDVRTILILRELALNITNTLILPPYGCSALVLLENSLSQGGIEWRGLPPRVRIKEKNKEENVK
jgi:hypothetical protein